MLIKEGDLMKNDKMQVGIITLHGYTNYGNKLQNYALQETVNGLGYEVNTIIIRKSKNSENVLVRKIKKIFKNSPKKIIEILSERKKKMTFYENNKELVDDRTRNFKVFSQEYLHETFWSDDFDNLSKLDKSYKFFITGSDQVWNPIYINEMNKYFLTFTAKEKRIAYAASFSCPDIPDKLKDKYKNWILGMPKISVREKAGLDIIKDLTGVSVPVLLDPTLLLSKEKWLSISKKASNRPEGSYILTYFLGEIDEKTKNYIESLAKEKSFKIINLADMKDYKSYVTGPSEFIDYINSASVLFTDSFHGIVFSILMETPFVVYKRIGKSASMYSRIETLLDMFDLRSREVKNIKNNQQIFDMDLSNVGPILELERKKALNYLKEALNVKNNF